MGKALSRLTRENSTSVNGAAPTESTPLSNTFESGDQGRLHESRGIMARARSCIPKVSNPFKRWPRSRGNGFSFANAKNIFTPDLMNFWFSIALFQAIIFNMTSMYLHTYAQEAAEQIHDFATDKYLDVLFPFLNLLVLTPVAMVALYALKLIEDAGVFALKKVTADKLDIEHLNLVPSSAKQPILKDHVAVPFIPPMPIVRRLLSGMEHFKMYVPPRLAWSMLLSVSVMQIYTADSVNPVIAQNGTAAPTNGTGHGPHRFNEISELVNNEELAVYIIPYIVGALLNTVLTVVETAIQDQVHRDTKQLLKNEPANVNHLNPFKPGDLPNLLARRAQQGFSGCVNLFSRCRPTGDRGRSYSDDAMVYSISETDSAVS